MASARQADGVVKKDQWQVDQVAIDRQQASCEHHVRIMCTIGFKPAATICSILWSAKYSMTAVILVSHVSGGCLEQRLPPRLIDGTSGLEQDDGRAAARRAY